MENEIREVVNAGLAAADALVTETLEVLRDARLELIAIQHVMGVDKAAQIARIEDLIKKWESGRE